MRKWLLILLFSFFAGYYSILAQSGCIEEIATITDNATVFGIGIKDNYLYVNPGSPVIRIYDFSANTMVL